MSAEQLRTELRSYSLPVIAETERRLALYVHELNHWNRTINLTGLQGIELIRRLVVEPVWIGQVLQLSGTVADIGSGNGSPAIPLSLTAPITKLHLIEARTRRAAFLRHVSKALDLKGVTIHKARLEEMEPIDDPIDWITLQAVQPTPKILGSMRGLASPTTQVVWITSVKQPPVDAARLIPVPGDRTHVWVFRLDQS